MLILLHLNPELVVISCVWLLVTWFNTGLKVICSCWERFLPSAQLFECHLLVTYSSLVWYAAAESCCSFFALHWTGHTEHCAAERADCNRTCQGKAVFCMLYAFTQYALFKRLCLWMHQSSYEVWGLILLNPPSHTYFNLVIAPKAYKMIV